MSKYTVSRIEEVIQSPAVHKFMQKACSQSFVIWQIYNLFGRKKERKKENYWPYVHSITGFESIGKWEPYLCPRPHIFGRKEFVVFLAGNRRSKMVAQELANSSKTKSKIRACYIKTEDRKLGLKVKGYPFPCSRDILVLKKICNSIFR